MAKSTKKPKSGGKKKNVNDVPLVPKGGKGGKKKADTLLKCNGGKKGGCLTISFNNEISR